MSTIDKLLMQLKNTDEDLRVEAAIKLGEILDKKAFHGLLNSLGNESSGRVREFIIKSIGYFNDQNIIPLLLKYTNDEYYGVRFQALETLADLNPPKTSKIKSAIKRCLKDEDELVRTTAIETIYILDLKDFNNNLEEALEDKSPLVRRYAAFALGKIHSYTSKYILIKMLKNERYPIIRLGYYAGLYLLGVENYFPKILRLLSSKDDAVRVASAYIMMHLNKPNNISKVLGLLKKALQKENEEHVKNVFKEVIDNLTEI